MLQFLLGSGGSGSRTHNRAAYEAVQLPLQASRVGQFKLSPRLTDFTVLDNRYCQTSRTVDGNRTRVLP